MTTKLAHQTQKAAGIPNGMRTATITAVTGGAITISVSGGTFSSGVGVVTSYVPRVGDVVAVFRQDSSWLIIGPTSPANGWNLMVSLGYQNGWTDRGSPFALGQYRVTGSEVQMIGELNNASIPSGTIVAGIPAPAAECVVVGAMGNGTTVRPRLVVTSSGAFQVFDASAAGTLQFCFTYPLDPRIA